MSLFPNLRSLLSKFTSLSGIVLVVYIGGVFLFHTLPTSRFSLQGQIGLIDTTEALHFAIFFPWGLLAAHVSYRRPPGRVARSAFVWILLGLLLAALAEGGQILLEHRIFAWRDLFFNTAGIVAGTFSFLSARHVSAFCRRGGSRFGTNPVLGLLSDLSARKPTKYERIKSHSHRN
jgi:hypothetical protein